MNKQPQHTPTPGKDQQWMQEMCELVKNKIPITHCFAVFALPVTTGDRIYYAANGNRADTIVAISEWLEHQRRVENWMKHDDGPPPVDYATLRAENERLKAWQAEQQQALIKCAAALLSSGYKGDGIPDGTEWAASEITRLKAQRDSLCVLIARASQMRHQAIQKGNWPARSDWEQWDNEARGALAAVEKESA